EKVQSVALKYASGTGVANILNTTFGNRQPMHPGQTQQQQFRAASDPQNDRVVVVIGEPKDLTDARELIAKIDIDPDTGAIDHLVQLQHASASGLSEVLSARYGGSSRGSRGYGGSPGNSLPRFIPNDDSRTLIVVSTA